MWNAIVIASMQSRFVRSRLEPPSTMNPGGPSPRSIPGTILQPSIVPEIRCLKSSRERRRPCHEICSDRSPQAAFNIFLCCVLIISAQGSFTGQALQPKLHQIGARVPSLSANRSAVVAQCTVGDPKPPCTLALSQSGSHDQ